MPSLTGTLLADAHDLDVLAGTTAGNLPFEAFYIEGVEITFPSFELTPTDPDDWVRGTRWRTVRGTAWAAAGGTAWRTVEK